MARAAVRQFPSGNIASSQHPRYLEWLPTWRLLGWVYEGDGPFLDGTVLVPYPREVNYQRDPKSNEAVLGPSGRPVQQGLTEKFQRRKDIFTYDNIAAALLDMVIDHQYQKMPDREPSDDTMLPIVQDYLEWAQEDVDGTGASLDDWMRQTGRLAAVYGHLFVTLERRTDGVSQPVTAADLAPLVLRRYTPLDAPDWILDNAGNLKEVKLIEAVPRDSLLVPAKSGLLSPNLRATDATETHDAPEDYQIRRWTPDALMTYDRSGQLIDTVPHQLGQPPVLVFYARRRARIPLIGRSLLGDPRLYCDHANIGSELRELMRSQTFSMLAVELAEKQGVSEGRALLGDHAGTDKVIFHHGSAGFIAPPEGPIAQYIQVADRIERKMFKALGLQWEGDSNQAETAASRRIKATDLNRVLSGLGDEAEAFEYALARMWLMSQLGREAGIAAFNESEIRCAYPDEYFVDSALDRLEEIRQTQGLGFGTTFETLVRKNAVPVILPGVDDDVLEMIGTEIEAEAAKGVADAAAMAAMNTITAPAAGADTSGAGVPGPGGDTSAVPPSAQTPSDAGQHG